MSERDEKDRGKDNKIPRPRNRTTKMLEPEGGTDNSCSNRRARYSIMWYRKIFTNNFPARQI